MLTAPLPPNLRAAAPVIGRRLGLILIALAALIARALRRHPTQVKFLIPPVDPDHPYHPCHPRRPARRPRLGPRRCELARARHPARPSPRRFARRSGVDGDTGSAWNPPRRQQRPGVAKGGESALACFLHPAHRRLAHPRHPPRPPRPLGRRERERILTPLDHRRRPDADAPPRKSRPLVAHALARPKRFD